MLDPLLFRPMALGHRRRDRQADRDNPGNSRNSFCKETTDAAHASFLAEHHGFDSARRNRRRPIRQPPGARRRHHQGWHPSLAVRHHGNQRDHPEKRHADADRRPECPWRFVGQTDRARRRRSRLQLAPVRREGPRTDQPRSRRRGVRLLDLGFPQIRAASIRGTQRPAVLSAGIRRRRTVARTCSTAVPCPTTKRSRFCNT